jgi:hypothetical protein
LFCKVRDAVQAEAQVVRSISQELDGFRRLSRRQGVADDAEFQSDRPVGPVDTDPDVWPAPAPLPRRSVIRTQSSSAVDKTPQAARRKGQYGRMVFNGANLRYCL